MNKVLISTLKTAAVFMASGFIAYMVLKTQMKGANSKSLEKDSAQPAEVDAGSVTGENEESQNTNPVLTTIKLKDKGFHSSKSAPIALQDEEVVSLKAKEKQEFFHSSKAPLTTVVLENVEEKPEVPKNVISDREIRKQYVVMKELLDRFEKMQKELSEKDAEIARLKKQLGQ